MLEKELFNKYAPRILGALMLQDFSTLQNVLGDMSAEFLTKNNRAQIANLSAADLHYVVSSLTPTQGAIVSYAIDLFSKYNVKGLRSIK